MRCLMSFKAQGPKASKCFVTEKENRMSKLPPYQTTMIGSMPHASAEDAFATLAQHPLSIPSWPQLPKRSFLEGMIPQCSEGLPGVQVDHSSKRLWLENDENLACALADFYENIIE